MTVLSSAFQLCTSLTTIPPGLFKYNTKLLAVSGIFSYCDIRDIPEDIFSTCTLIAYFDLLFRENKNLSNIPDGLFDNNVNAVSFNAAFYETGVESVPGGLFKNNVKATTFKEVFAYCQQLKFVGDGLFNGTSATSLSRAFISCIKIGSNINSIFNLASYPGIYVTELAFNYCQLLKGSGLDFIAKLPNVTAASSKSNTFNQAISLSDYNQIPKAWGGGGS
ncbi:hypothetical protein BMI79_00905 [Serratia oryzae]|uniref:Uncharacterized protein n=2 Tax=Serratia oryzae TaxID=2034155 RepID=A0A1S8CNS4_9GAMM|nr:hypothetical protein BMI79_00905 [Serratia oryzae]